MRTGRPTKEAVAERRQKIRLFLCVSALASEQAIARIAEKLGVTEKVCKGDLDAIRDEIEHAPSEQMTEDLAQTIETADTFSQLKNLGKRIMLEMVKGTIDRALGSALVEAIREQRQVLLRERDEAAEAAVTALEVLTPQEQDALRRYRESLVPESLKPGEFPAPPEGAALPKAPDDNRSPPNAEEGDQEDEDKVP